MTTSNDDVITQHERLNSSMKDHIEQVEFKMSMKERTGMKGRGEEERQLGKEW